ncbi:hypothetical protein HGA92_02290 [Candidatus Gracilibacteria bacterium]|nr:hypothetical protein [Candidatus Gracilibacteria bacterium]NUJ99396.1 hypothetical protein [Candidatus Gracilibacteria bacterium]
MSIQEKLKNNTKLNLLEKELLRSSFRDNYVEQRRILVGVGNLGFLYYKREEAIKTDGKFSSIHG